MGKYVHSYSAIADWKLCPRLYKRKHLDKAYPFEETAATRRGNRLHKKMEDVFEKGGGVPYEYKGNVGLVKLLQTHGARAEVKIGITRDGRGCNFFDNNNVWLRGKIDVYKALTDQRAAIMVDWKTGNPNYTDEFQADVYAAAITSATLVDRVLFIWGYFSGEMPHKVVDGKEAQDRVWRVLEAVEADTEYAPTPCWKCRWCPVAECEYNRGEE